MRDPFRASDYTPSASATRTWPGLNDILKDMVDGDKNVTFSENSSKQAGTQKRVMITQERNKRKISKKLYFQEKNRTFLILGWQKSKT